MKRLFALLFLCAPVYAGTITTGFNPLGTITFSSSTFVSGPIALDTATYSAADATAGATCTWSMNIGNGNTTGNRGFFLACAGEGSGSADNVSIASVGGRNLNKLKVVNQGLFSAELWYTTATVTGSQTVSVTPTTGNCGGGTSNVECAAYSYVNVNQNTPVDVSTGAADGSGSFAIISTTATLTGSTDLVLDVVNMNTTGFTLTANTGQTPLTVFKNTNQGFTLGSSEKGPLSVSGNQFMTWTASSIGGSFAQAVVAIQKAP